MDLEDSFRLFFDLLEHPKIMIFLTKDHCRLMADKYILATIFIYFRRANFEKHEYNKRNFYLAMYLAHELLEDVYEFRDVIVESCLGPKRQFKKYHFEKFLENRFELLARTDFKSNVSQADCRFFMAMQPHWAWTRTRRRDHAGVFYKHIQCEKCYCAEVSK